MNYTNLFIIIYLVSTLCSCAENESKKNSANSENSSANEGKLVSAAGKKDMILLTDRPANLETPLEYFKQDFTPNDVFFVRWHLANIPSEIDIDTFRLRIGGQVQNKLSLSINDLKTKFQPYSINALCVCAGNARSFCKPRVAGAQWANGGMGNAKWTGVKLKDILAAAGVNSKAKYISFGGMDAPPLPSVPDFVKSLPYELANNDEVMVAYKMNGDYLPLLNGYPLKLIVPGWYASYWVGMLNEINVYQDTFKGFWMEKAYLVPKGIENGNEKHDSLAKNLVPISKIDVRSIFVSPTPNSKFKLGNIYELQGLAFDGGDGISKVEISHDSGATWIQTKLDPSIGIYSWRRWRYSYRASKIGNQKFYIKATNAKGQTQPWHHWNRSGYMRNEIESIVYIVH